MIDLTSRPRRHGVRVRGRRQLAFVVADALLAHARDRGLALGRFELARDGARRQERRGTPKRAGLGAARE
jgi:hypothetical protein